MATRVHERDDEDLIKAYLNDIGKHALLTKDDEARLAQLIETGAAAAAVLDAGTPLDAGERRRCRRAVRDGETASTEFVQANLRLVVSIAKKYQASGVPLLDLVQEGNLGLIHAVGKFDWRKGFKFSTYATWWIRQSITRGIANTGRTIRLPVHAGDTLKQVHRVGGDIEARLGRSATVDEIAAALGIDPVKITEVLQYAAPTTSLSAPLGDADSDRELGDVVPDAGGDNPADAAVRAVLPQEVAKLLDTLTEREQQIISMRFGLADTEPSSLEQIGAVIGLTRERIRQIESRAMAKLRHPAVDGGTRDLLYG